MIQRKHRVSWLLLSGILPAEMQRELTEVAEVLDPIGLFHQLRQLQQAVFRCAGVVPTKIPMAGEWEQILSWLVANPERA